MRINNFMSISFISFLLYLFKPKLEKTDNVYVKLFFLASFIIFQFLSVTTVFSQEKLKVYFLLSVDWEGDTLRDANLAAMQRFNRAFPEFPVIHFLNAAYYTKNWEMSEMEVTSRIKSVLKSNDEIGMHIHSWENFVKASGVEFRDGPSFWGDLSISRNGERGDDVPLNSYSEKEIQKQISYSKKVFKKFGLGIPKSFRGGGWMSGSNVWNALVKEGIYIDSSAVPGELVNNLYPDSNLSKLHQALWLGIDETLGPYHTTEQKIQFPNNLGLADYVDEIEFMDKYLRLYRQAVQSGKKELYIHFGWHQESAVEYFKHDENNHGRMRLVRSDYLERVEKIINTVKAHAQKNNVELIPSGFEKFPKMKILGQGAACASIARGIFLKSK